MDLLLLLVTGAAIRRGAEHGDAPEWVGLDVDDFAVSEDDRATVTIRRNGGELGVVPDHLLARNSVGGCGNRLIDGDRGGEIAGLECDGGEATQ